MVPDQPASCYENPIYEDTRVLNRYPGWYFGLSQKWGEVWEKRYQKIEFILVPIVHFVGKNIQREMCREKSRKYWHNMLSCGGCYHRIKVKEKIQTRRGVTQKEATNDGWTCNYVRNYYWGSPYHMIWGGRIEKLAINKTLCLSMQW